MHYEIAPAKINLTLDTLYKRDDGYHEVSMVMTTVDLNDNLSFEKRRDRKIIIESDHQFVPTDRRNLAYQAAQLMMRRYKIKTGVTINIDKHIPIAAGLAGGSADAAATFRGMNALYNLGVGLDELAALSSELGSDIPFCVYGGTALATGRGEIIERLPRPPHAWVVLAKPSVSVSTKTIYGALKPGKNKPASELMKKAIIDEDYEQILGTLKNDLEEVTVKKYPQVRKLLDNMKESGADGALMSGSGPTVFGIVRKERQSIHLYNAMKGCCAEVYRIRLLG
ncbi:4-(cytidine 5'-diphospho)-2-C-methyl-D-erythritol kinase [Jeotgalicoccus nanhaiensis]|uniref:4-diphosphocytidyl-2-C-methyl-D-erythritol kinase n=1 Tax=Jeotgalicoccus nanhaiensis TaxID=568603 RepID=A0ABR9Y071_9STAP|nr:4-(cytidine 5'-diphospho)-2-C-methyl-D-erythritol kinase [Jeotgalicoccus nanhaiensis]MBF0754636.1 4-(cytidine 5'-diphospho)-2-C-methyl-D-erythritol kinase [Jeotgalicoccus nanhaiensis]TFU60982.1 4-(cytidine 5'-diphospho)-2-C-methyl-D-erythritol kinase [Jeotgalicoccus nanhaiensis]